MNVPTVTFIYAYPLDVNRRNLFKERSLGPYPSIEEVGEVKQKWENLWKKINYDNQIVNKLVEVTGRVPTRALECFIFGGGLQATSAPLLMPIMDRKGIKTDENFIDTLIHEPLHIFVTTNNKAYWTMVHKKYADEEVLTQNHIIIYAMLEEIHNEFFRQLPPEYSEADLPKGYARAIEIVKNTGYKELIAEYKSLLV
jgi:hypothetical protein